jgi:signal transduction histidine kinase
VVRCEKIYLEDKPIEIKLYIQPEMIISVDAHYIQQTIDNIIINAIKFSNQGTIIVKSYRDDEFVVIIIEDEGIGIPKHDLYDIFTPFKMGSNTTSKAEGRGVGLALCKTAVEAHGGNIVVNSYGTGAKFTIKLPI